MKRRKFLKTTGTGLVLFGSGLIGVPVGACRTKVESGERGSLDRGGTGLDDLLDPAELDEMSEQEAADFLAEIDSAAADLRSELDAQGRPRVPPGQHVVESLPVLGRNPDPRDEAEWTFTVTGQVANPLELTWDRFEALPHVDLTTDIHCVTGWTMLDTRWRGVRVSHLLDLAQVNDSARFVVFDCERGYTTNIALAEARKENVLIATGLFDAPLPQEYGGLARGLVPDLYFYKSGKWVTGIRILAQDEPGFWETRGYSNTADPWSEDRYG